jgi:GMP synthase-like glutamine amidotransferase
MRAHYLQHVPFEGLGSIEQSLRSTGYEITRTALFESAEFPSIDSIDLLVVMGGPMSVNDSDEFPWLVQEMEFIRGAIHSGTPVLGICLGAQLIAAAMGSKVYQNRVKEIGWFPVDGLCSTDGPHFCLPPSLQVFHWHGETFDLPAGATPLASSEGCENQAFQIGRSVIALQFHLETTPESVQEIVSNCRDELVPAQYVQAEEEILAAGSESYQEINRVMDGLLQYLQSSGS